MRVVGLDGWRGGWVGVVLESGRFRSAEVYPHAAEVVAAHPAAAVMAADMPIGLPATGRRRADGLARAMLGERRSSVFFAPPRDVVETESYEAANALAKAKHGFGISKQSYMLRDKILELDELLAGGAIVYEVHPEVAFRRLSEAPLASKKTYAGQRARQRLLTDAGVELPADIGAAGIVPVDDVLDAAVVALTAHRIADGQSGSLPDPPDVDDRGRPMAIWF